MQWGELSNHLYNLPFLPKASIWLFQHYIIVVLVPVFFWIIVVVMLVVRVKNGGLGIYKRENSFNLVAVAKVELKNKPSLRALTGLSSFSYVLLLVLLLFRHLRDQLSLLGAESVWQLSPAGVSYLLKVVASFGALAFALVITSLLGPIDWVVLVRGHNGENGDGGSRRHNNFVNMLTTAIPPLWATVGFVVLCYLAIFTTERNKSLNQSHRVIGKAGDVSAALLYDEKQDSQIARVVLGHVHMKKDDVGLPKVELPNGFDVVKRTFLNAPLRILFVLNIDSASVRDDIRSSSELVLSKYWGMVYDELLEDFNFSDEDEDSDVARIYLLGGSQCRNDEPLLRGTYLVESRNRNEVFNTLMHATYECAYFDLNRPHFPAQETAASLSQIVEENSGWKPNLVIVLNWSDNVDSLNDLFRSPIGEEETPKILIQRNKDLGSSKNRRIQAVPLFDPKSMEGAVSLKNMEGKELLREEFASIGYIIKEKRNYKEIVEVRNKKFLRDKGAFGKVVFQGRKEEVFSLSIPGDTAPRVPLSSEDWFWIKVWPAFSIATVLSEVVLCWLVLFYTRFPDFQRAAEKRLSDLKSGES